MGRSRCNRSKRRKNPALAPPVSPAGPAAAAAPGAAAQEEAHEDSDDQEYQLSEEHLQGDEEVVDLNLALRDEFKDCKVFVKDLNHATSLISAEELKEAYKRKWLKNAGEALVSLIHDIQENELKIRIKGGKPMPRPPEIQVFITLFNRIY